MKNVIISLIFSLLLFSCGLNNPSDYELKENEVRVTFMLPSEISEVNIYGDIWIGDTIYSDVEPETKILKKGVQYEFEWDYEVGRVPMEIDFAVESQDIIIYIDEVNQKIINYIENPVEHYENNFNLFK